MKLNLTIILINFIIIKMKDNLTYNSSIDNLFEDEEIVDIKDIINDIDKFLNDAIDDIDNLNILNNDIIEIDLNDIINDDEYMEEELEENESIWPERPIPQYKFIV